MSASSNYKAFACGDRVRFSLGTEHDTGEVLDPEVDSDGRIHVRWTSGAATWARIDRLEPLPNSLE